MNTAFVTILLVGYAILVAAIGLQGRKVAQNSDMFNIFGRRAGTLRATAGYLSLVGGGELVTITALGYSNGWDAAWFFGGVSVGFIALAFFAYRPKRLADQAQSNTLADFYASQYGLSACVASIAIFVLSLGSLLTIQFVVGAELLSAIAGIPRLVSILAIGCVVLSYLMVAGYVAVLSTDLLRAVFMSLVLVIIVGATFVTVGRVDLSAAVFEPLGFPLNAIYAVLGFFGALSAADVWQTIFASKDRAVIRRSLLASAIIFSSIGILIAVLGMLTRAAISEIPSDATAFVVATTQVVPAILAPLVAVLVLGSVMATADTEIWVISTLLLSYFSRRSAPANGSTQAVRSADWLKATTKSLMPIVAGASMLAAYFASDAQAIYTSLLSVVSVGGPAILAAMFLPPNRWGVSASLWSGLAAYVGMLLYYGLDMPPEMTLVPIMIACGGYVLGWVGTLLMKSSKVG